MCKILIAAGRKKKGVAQEIFKKGRTDRILVIVWGEEEEGDEEDAQNSIVSAVSG